MASNSLGNVFKITTWGESHGRAIGVVIDGCPAGLEITEADIREALALRSPGNNPYTSPRKEQDQAEILSGVFQNKTTGAPISILIPNQNADSSKYEKVKDLLKPGHANYTYLEKYGIFDYRGGGRSSARETACRVAAGAIAKKLLIHYGIDILAYITQIGTVQASIDKSDFLTLRGMTKKSILSCPDIEATNAMVSLLEIVKKEGDSLGGIIEFMAISLPAGLGDPIYEKLEANLAHAMMSLPATKGFEIGSGFNAASLQGSEHNDIFIKEKETVQTKKNHAGGILGGISTGMPLIGKVAFKPASSIKKSQETLTIEKKPALFELPEGSKHDPCVAIRAVPVVEAMLALVLVDAILLNKCAKL